MLKKMRWIATLLIGGLCFAASAGTQTVDRSDPYQLIEVVSQQLFDALKAEEAAIQADPELLKSIVDRELMPYVNYRYAALKVLGAHLKKAKKADVRAFIDAFHGYLVTSYAQVLTLYSDQGIAFASRKMVPTSKRIVGIKVDILDPPRPNIKLEFKMRREKSGDWLAFDMVAEGISLLSSKQSEWSGKLRTDGIPAVTQELIRLSKQPIRLEEDKS